MEHQNKARAPRFLTLFQVSNVLFRCHFRLPIAPPLCGSCDVNTKKIVCWLTVCWWACVQISYASSFLLNNTDQLINKSAAIFRGNVVDLEAYRGSDGGIYTRVIFRVNEVFKGKLPFYVQVTHRGGVFGREGEADGFGTEVKLWQERLL